MYSAGTETVGGVWQPAEHLHYHVGTLNGILDYHTELKSPMLDACSLMLVKSACYQQ